MAYLDKGKQREAARKHYLLNKDTIKKRARKFSDANRVILKSYLIEAKSKPCADCGGVFPSCVMDFDHIGDKKHNVSCMVSASYSLEAMKAEIAKCEVVCANCHRIRTFKRRQK